MKPALIFFFFFWIINKLKTCSGLTFEDLNRKWVADRVSDGNPLAVATFHRHRHDILDMFGIIIACNKRTYEYYISSPDAMRDGSVEQWLFSTLTVHGVLAESTAVEGRLVLENVPAGLEFLDAIISGIKTNSRLRIGYQKFDTEGYVKTVCPYALKLFHQRWYLLARTEDDQMRIYALDRMTMIERTDISFKMPDDFSAQDYFNDYFGVLTDGTPMAHVVVRAYRWTPNYLRTLPLHHSQRELTSTPDYTDFSFDIRPTSDFLGQLLSHGDGLEVLEPSDLRQKMRDMIAENLKRY